MEKLLVIGDVQIAEELRSGFDKEYRVVVAAGHPHATGLFVKHAPKVVVLDLELRPPAQGGSPRARELSESFRSLQWIIESRPGTKVVVLTGAGECDTGYHAVHCGAYDFHQKPLDLSKLKIVIAHAFYLSGLEEQSCRLKEALLRSSDGLEGIAGQCAAMRELFGTFQRVALGETVPVSERTGAGRGPAGRVRQTGAAVAAKGHKRGEGSCARAGGALSVRPGPFTPPAEHLTLREVRDRVERGMITAAVGNCGGNMVRASELLGVSRPALYDLMKKHGLFKPAARP